jgi:HlyD family secretion protein
MKSVKAQGKDPGVTRGRAAWIVIILCLLALMAGAGAWYLGEKTGSRLFPWSAQAAAGAQEQTYTTSVRRGDIRISASGSGTLVAAQSVDLHFPVSGTVVELNVQAGDTVEAGQVLARLGNSESLQAELAAAELELLQARKELQDLQENAGTALAEAYQDWIDAQQSLEEAQVSEQRSSGARCSKETNTQYAAALDRAAQRLENMRPEDPASPVAIDAKNDYDSALANYQYCIAYNPLEKTSAGAALAVARRALERADENYNVLKDGAGINPNELALAEAQVKQAETQIALAAENLQGMTLRAPFAGKVTYLAAAEGAMVGSDTFLTVAAAGRLAVEVSVDESDLNTMVAGSTARVIFDVLPDQVLGGRLVQVEPALVSSGQYQVARGLVELDAEAVRVLQGLPLGLNGSVEIVRQEASGVLLVPLSALKDLGGGEYALFVMDADGQLRMRVVEVGIQDLTYAEIIHGVNQGDVVSTGIVQAAGAE